MSRVPKEIERQLGPDEEVLSVHSGRRAGTLVCTSERVWISKRGETLSKEVQSYPYNQISSVHVSYGKWWQPIIGGDSMTVLHVTAAGVQDRLQSSDMDRVFAPNTVLFGSGKKQHALADEAAAQIREGMQRSSERARSQEA